MSNLMLSISAGIIYFYAPSIISGIVLLTVYRTKKNFDLESLQRWQLRLSLYFQSFLSGAGIYLLLAVTNRGDCLENLAPASSGFNWISLLLKAMSFTALIQWGTWWEKRYFYGDNKTQNSLKVKENLGNMTTVPYILFFTNMIILTPILEEFVFRYLFLADIDSQSFPIGVNLIISALFFSWIHRKNHLTFFLGGIFMGINFWTTNSYLECVFIHIINNLWVDASFRMKMF